MKENQALEILIRAAHRGQAKGVFTLEEAAVLAEAISLLTQQAGEEKTAENPHSS